jgi:hypothetical protein
MKNQVRVLSLEHRHAYWATREEALRLVHAGYARNYGTRGKTVGVILSVSLAQASECAQAPEPIVREHVAGKWYVWAFARAAA